MKNYRSCHAEFISVSRLNGKHYLPAGRRSRTKFGMTIFIVALFFVFLAFGSRPANAQTVVYPISELGNCRDAKECYFYCEVPANQPACWSYGKYVLKQGQVLADQTESDQAMAQKYNITFPIAELGNCTNINECKSYCSDPSHQQTCIDFAKKKGFYKEASASNTGSSQISDQKKQELLQAAKTELGCDSFETCKAFCEQNHQKCADFGQRHGFSQPSPNPTEVQQKNELLQAAQAELGCSSMESCRAVCEQNHEKCMAFMQKHGLTSSQPSQVPKSSQNPRSFNSQTSGTTASSSASASPGCKTEAECKQYCLSSPDHCPGFPKPNISSYPSYAYPSDYQKQQSGSSYQYPSDYPKPSAYPSYTYPSYYPKPSSYQNYPTYYPQPTYSGSTGATYPSPYPTYSSGTYQPQ